MKVLFSLIALAISFSLELVAMDKDGARGLNREYYAQSADEKREYIWKNILSSRHEMLPALSWQGWFSFYRDFDRFLQENRSTSDDIRPARQQRIMFAQGTVAKVRYVSTFKGFDGIYADDALALMRCSLFADPEAIGSYIPFVALRFLIDDSPGISVAFMDSFQGQAGNHNWFHRSLSNIINPSSFGRYALIDLMLNKTLAKPFHMSIELLAKRRSNGRLSFNNRGPYELILEPHNTLREFILPQTLKDFREELSRVPVGSTLYDVKALDYKDGAYFTIGQIKLESEFVASDYGDTRVGF